MLFRSDGVEYPVDTPRYLPNGQLLIEGQATNLLTWSSRPDAIGLSLTEFDGFYKYTYVAGARYPQSASNVFSVKKGDVINFSGKLVDTDGPNIGFVLYSPDGFNEEVIATRAGEWFSGEFVVTMDSDRATLRTYLDRGNEYPTNGTYFVLYGTQVTINSGASSYIPTNGTAVTRAADECFVDYQLPPNKYRDLKGFNA